MQEKPDSLRTVNAGRYTLRRDGQRLTINDGSDGTINTGSVPTAKALLRFMAFRPIKEGEVLQSWLTRCVKDYEAAVWVRLGKGRR